MRLILIVLLVGSVTALARPIEPLTYQQLHDRADLILILKVQGITETDAKTNEYPDPDFYQGYLARCEVLSVLKGSLARTNVAIPFFQNPKGIPGFNGAIVAPFTLRDNLVYLAYLKRRPSGDLVPVTGEYDAGRSIKMMFHEGRDIVPLKLPPHTAKKAPGAAPNAAPPHR
jgi:hypothetical protein